MCLRLIAETDARSVGDSTIESGTPVENMGIAVGIFVNSYIRT